MELFLLVILWSYSSILLFVGFIFCLYLKWNYVSILCKRVLVVY